MSLPAKNIVRMKGIKIILLFVVVEVYHCSELPWRKHNIYDSALDDQGCSQSQPSCQECLSKEGNCEWCSDESLTSQCVSQGSKTCPREYRRTECSAQTADNRKRGSVKAYYDQSLDELSAVNNVMADDSAAGNSSVVTMNVTAFCGSQGGCENCTGREFCVWCQSKQTCQAYYNSSTTEQSCPEEKTAYKGQCIYPIGVIPCHERKRSCKKCLHQDAMCYWCSSTEKCARFPSVNFEPDDCPKEDWHHKKCPMANDLLWVLLPILAIILIPIIVYLIIWLICCCMRAAGYEPLEPTEPSKKKHPKGIRLKPGSPSNKTDELRRKYDLNNP